MSLCAKKGEKERRKKGREERKRREKRKREEREESGKREGVEVEVASKSGGVQEEGGPKEALSRREKSVTLVRMKAAASTCQCTWGPALASARSWDLVPRHWT